MPLSTSPCSAAEGPAASASPAASPCWSADVVSRSDTAPPSARPPSPSCFRLPAAAAAAPRLWGCFCFFCLCCCCCTWPRRCCRPTSCSVSLSAATPPSPAAVAAAAAALLLRWVLARRTLPSPDLLLVLGSHAPSPCAAADSQQQRERHPSVMHSYCKCVPKDTDKQYACAEHPSNTCHRVLLLPQPTPHATAAAAR
jgi:hypothetical protein